MYLSQGSQVRHPGVTWEVVLATKRIILVAKRIILLTKRIDVWSPGLQPCHNPPGLTWERVDLGAG
jgi:hypothetical protein